MTQQPKPACYGPEHAAAFQQAGVASAYQFRPTYPPAVFALLATLLHDQPRRVLDVGCGTGLLARHLVAIADHVDALDVSPAMIAQGKQLPNGAHPGLRWLLGRAEDAPLAPPYGLITAGDSLHWMDWPMVMPRFGELLAPGGVLAILELNTAPPPWNEALIAIIKQFSTNRNYQPLDLPTALEARNLFTIQGQQHTDATSFAQSVDAYVESFHGRAGFSRERMTAQDAAAFDHAVRAVVAPHADNGVVLQVYATVTWGLPHGGTA